jgi:hypothetical protein
VRRGTTVLALELLPAASCSHASRRPDTTNAGAVKPYLLTERCLLLRAATPGASCAPS